MLVRSIEKARSAAIQVRQTQAQIRDVCELRSCAGYCSVGRTGVHSDTVAMAVQIRDKLERQLAEQKAYAERCHEEMNTMLNAVPDPIVRMLFYCRHYCKLTWKETASQVELSEAAAKMRYKRYWEREVRQNAA